MGVKHMQGVPAQLEYLHVKDRKKTVSNILHIL